LKSTTVLKDVTALEEEGERLQSQQFGRDEILIS
jgi:hypothetical protein